MGKIDGIVDVHRELQVEVPQVEVEVDLAAAQRYGIKPGDVRRAAATLINGEEVGDVFSAGKAYDVHVWSVPATRTSLADIAALPIDTADGHQIALRDVAAVRLAPTPNAVVHEDLARRILVGANVEGRDLGSAVRDVEAALAQVSFPRGYHAELVGELTERRAADQRLLLVAVVAAIGIFLLLQASFGRTRLALLS